MGFGVRNDREYGIRAERSSVADLGCVCFLVVTFIVVRSMPDRYRVFSWHSASLSCPCRATELLSKICRLYVSARGLNDSRST